MIEKVGILFILSSIPLFIYSSLSIRNYMLSWLWAILINSVLLIWSPDLGMDTMRFARIPIGYLPFISCIMGGLVHIARLNFSKKREVYFLFCLTYFCFMDS